MTAKDSAKFQGYVRLGDTTYSVSKPERRGDLPWPWLDPIVEPTSLDTIEVRGIPGNAIPVVSGGKYDDGIFSGACEALCSEARWK